MIDKFGGYKTQVRVLEKKLKEMDHSKLNPAKVKELTEAIQNLKNIVKEKEDKRIERKKKKDEAAKAAPVEVEKEASNDCPYCGKDKDTYTHEFCKPGSKGEKNAAPTQPEVTKESTVEKFAIDSKVEPIRGTPGSVGVVIREAGVNGDPLVYVKWMEGNLKTAHGEYGAYYPSDLRLKAEEKKEAVNTDYVPRDQVYNLEADLKSNYEGMIKHLEEEIQQAKDKADYAWLGRLEEKLADIKKAYDDKYGKTAENENGSGGTEKLKVVDLNPPYDKDPQEKATGYGGDRSMGALVAPNSDENSLPLESSKYTGDIDKDLKVLMPHIVADGVTSDRATSDWLVNRAREIYKANPAWGQTVAKEDGHARDFLFKFMEHWLKAKEQGAPSTLEASLKEAAEFSGHGLGQGLNDLYVLPASPEEAQKIEDYLKQNGRSYQWSLSDVEGQPWYGKRFIEVPFGEGLKAEIEKLVGGKVEASLVKRAINITIAEKLFVVNPLGKTAEEEYGYDVSLANGNKLFKITAKDDLNQENIAKIIETELSREQGNTKEAKNKCAICNMEFDTWPEYDAHKKEKHGPKMATLKSNLAFLKKGSLVSILDVDNSKKQVKFAALDNSIRGWAPMSKFAAYDVPSANLVDHAGHKDEVLADNGGKELLVLCPAGSVNVEWRTVEAPPATPESLNPDVIAAKDCPDCHGNFVGGEGEKCPTCGRFAVAASVGKEARGCDQCEATMINGVFCHETGCPNARKEREQEDMEMESSLNKDAHIRHEDGKWVIYSHDYKKKLGTYDSKEAAEKRLKQIEYFKHQGSLKPLSKKEAGIMDTKCEECGEPLGPEAFLSKWPVCGKCTKKRHEKALGKHKKADQEISLEQQVQGFRDRMNAVSERLANPPAKTADLETTQDLSNVDVKDLSGAVLHIIDLLESKIGTDVSADPELHPMLEDLENKVYEIEMKLGIKPNLPEHEKLEPEHQEVLKEIGEEPVEKESDMSNVPPATPAPQGFRYAWEPVNKEWIMVADPNATGTGTGGTY